jgi:serine/threonine protein phosphatase PrpC
MKAFTFDTATLSERGLVRDNNEDSSFMFETSLPVGSRAVSLGIYIVADGMGGHQAGEIASKMAVQIISATLLERFKASESMTSPYLLVKEAFNKANAEIYARAHASPLLSSMGTTATLGLRLDDRLYLGHIGDSRAYLIRAGKIKQLTEDHSVVAQLLKAGMITPEEAETHPDRGKILRCLGTSAQVAIDTNSQRDNKDQLILKGDDSLVFCTDGLTRHVSDNEILVCVKKADAYTACGDLIRLANSRGGEDNISLIIVKVKSSASRKGRLFRMSLGKRSK